jgi:hypothetical protein
MRFYILIASVRALVRWRASCGPSVSHHSIRFQQHLDRHCAHECNHNGSAPVKPQLTRRVIGCTARGRFDKTDDGHFSTSASVALTEGHRLKRFARLFENVRTSRLAARKCAVREGSRAATSTTSIHPTPFALQELAFNGEQEQFYAIHRVSNLSARWIDTF